MRHDSERFPFHEIVTVGLGASAAEVFAHWMTTPDFHRT